jgi:hypothetical protein
MLKRIAVSALLLYAFALPGLAENSMPPTGHYLFAWTGDADKKANDFLAVIDADPASARYGQLVTTLGTDQQTVRIHHTEYVMPASGMLFANDHDVGRTFIFDRAPLDIRSKAAIPKNRQADGSVLSFLISGKLAPALRVLGRHPLQADRLSPPGCRLQTRTRSPLSIEEAPRTSPCR